MNMINMNWREAIKHAQQKIDKVLDIRPEENIEQGSSTATVSNYEDATSSKNDISPNSISPRSEEEQIVVCEPVLPPSSHGHIIGDDIQTIISSDIEILPESNNTSPEIIDDIDVPDFQEILKNNTLLKEKLENEKRKHLELKEQNAKLCAKSSSIEKNFESFKCEATKFSQEAFKARQDAKQSRAKIEELTKELESMEEKLAARDTKIKGMKNAMEDNLAIVKKYTNSNNAQAESIKKFNDEIAEKTSRIQELELIIQSFEHKKEDEKTGSTYMDDMLEETVIGLKMEIEEYKKQNAILLDSYQLLEQEMETRRFQYDQQLTEAVHASQMNFAQEVSSLRIDLENVTQEKHELEKKYSNTNQVVEKLLKLLDFTRKEMDSIRRTVQELPNFIASEHIRIGKEFQRSFYCSAEKIKKETEFFRNKLKNMIPTNVEEKSMQTEDIGIFQSQTPSNSGKCENCMNDESPQQNGSFNISEMKRMINELSFQKDQLETTKRITDLELKETKRQLSEALIMHGEKIEELEEIKIDNEDLRCILRQQALSLTHDEN